MFTGFSEQTIDFLWGIRMNNERGWFEEHKQDYQTELLRPMKELAQDCYDYLHKKYPDLDMMCRVSRIYRDARRLFGRGPYKDHLWFTVEQPSETHSGTPALWFEISPEGWSCGLGYWMPKPSTMAKLRVRIKNRPDEFRALLRKVEGKTMFHLQAQTYKRPKGQAPAEDLAVWYTVKNFAWEYDASVGEILYSAELAETLKQGYDKLMPWFAYLSTLDGDPDPEEEVHA